MIVETEIEYEPGKRMKVRYDENFPPGSWTRRVRLHWKEHHPRLYRMLEREGTLLQEALRVENLAAEEYDSLRRSGLNHYEAQEIVVREIILTPPPNARERRRPEASITESRRRTASASRSAPRNDTGPTSPPSGS